MNIFNYSVGTKIIDFNSNNTLILSSEFETYCPQYIAINLDEDQNNWINLLANYKFGGIQEYRCANFEDLKNKWAITKIHRTLILDDKGKIKDAFTNLFEVKFEDKLK